MDANNVSSSSMHLEGLKLVADLWKVIEDMTHRIDSDANGHLRITTVQGRNMKETMVYVVHRLTFLEMVTKGLAYMEMHDAKAYAKFIDSKRKLEDMDIEELRVLLR